MKEPHSSRRDGVYECTPYFLDTSSVGLDFWVRPDYRLEVRCIFVLWDSIVYVKGVV